MRYAMPILLLVCISACSIPTRNKTAQPNLQIFFGCGSEATDFSAAIDGKTIGSLEVPPIGNMAPCVDTLNAKVPPGKHQLEVTSARLSAKGQATINVSDSGTWILSLSTADPRVIELRQEPRAPRFE